MSGVIPTHVRWFRDVSVTKDVTYLYFAWLYRHFHDRLQLTVVASPADVGVCASADILERFDGQAHIPRLFIRKPLY